MNNFTKKELKKQHEKNGECKSCGWHAFFYEMDYMLTGEIVNDLNEWWGFCKSDNYTDVSDHRGCFVYTRVNDE